MLTIIRDLIIKETGKDPLQIQSLSGGSINKAYKVITQNEQLFIKLNNKEKYPGMFSLESKGLELLQASDFKIPKVRSHGEYNNNSYLILEYLKNISCQHLDWEQFGEKLAKLHLITNAKFGLDHNNYIGSLTQQNHKENSWSEFYSDHRLLPLVKLGFDQHVLSKKELQQFDQLCHRLEIIIPNEPPSLLHGDLWQGNLLCGNNNEPILIDPAVYYGHREMDLAMLELFGSIPKSAIISYNSIFELEKDWKDRFPVHQLYPLLVHLILFGRSYLGSIQAILNRHC